MQHNDKEQFEQLVQAQEWENARALLEKMLRDDPANKGAVLIGATQLYSKLYELLGEEYVREMEEIVEQMKTLTEQEEILDKVLRRKEIEAAIDKAAQKKTNDKQE